MCLITFNCRFKGSDDYLRTKFEEYISAALAAVKLRDFVAKSEGSGVMITDGSGAEFSAPARSGQGANIILFQVPTPNHWRTLTCCG